MPLRDHFHPPQSRRHSWEGLFAMWPAMMIEPLNTVLPEEFAAGPRIRNGTNEEDLFRGEEPIDPPPTLTAVDEFTDGYEYELRVEDQLYGRTAAVVKLVCPRNKDRPAARRGFAVSAAATLRRTNSLAIVDIVTEPVGNLLDETLALCGVAAPPLAFDRNRPYAVAIRRRESRGSAVLDVWAYPLEVDQPLPTLPLWLRDYICVPLHLDDSYESACRSLRIR